MKNMYRIVAKFEYNNNKYFIALVNGRNVVLVKYDENKNISTSFSDEEYKLLNIVYNSLLINKDKSVYIKDLKVKDILYKIYYDTQSKNYFWESVNGIDNEECNRILNFKYNNMKCVYYLDDKDNEDEKDSKAKKNLTAFDELERIAEETLASLEKWELKKEIEIKEQEDQIDESKNDETEKESEISEVEIDGNQTEPEQPETFEEISEISEEVEEEKTEESIVDETLKEAVIDEDLEDILDEEDAKEEELEQIVENIETNVEENIEETLDVEEQENSKDNFDQPLDEIIKQVVAIVQKQKIEQDLQKMKELEEEKRREQQRKVKEKKLEYHRKFVRFKKKIVPIMVSSTMLLAPLINLPVVGSQGRKENNVLQSMTEDSKKINNYDYEKIKSAIQDNPYLGSEEKEFLYKLKLVFDEDYKYMDLDLIEERLNSLKVSYNDDYVASKTDNFSFVGGTYNEFENRISINGASDFETSNIVDFVHETFHVFQQSSQRYVMELFNEGYKREKLRELKDKGILDEKSFMDSTNTYSNFGTGYSDDLYVYYTLASLMDEKSIKEYQYTCDDKIIVNELMKIDKKSSKDEATKNAYQLLDSIDELRIWDEETRCYRTNSEAKDDVFEKLNYYYVQKNGINLDEDLKFVIHNMYASDKTYGALEKTLLDEIDIQENGTNKIFGPWRTIVPRTYLTNNYEYSSITFNSPEMITIEIDDELCEKYQKNYEIIKENNRIANEDKDDDMER